MNPLSASVMPLVKEPELSGVPARPSATKSVDETAKVDPREAERLAEAGREFEAVLVRYMLRSLEKTSGIAGARSAAAGQSTYRSMMVDAVADAIAAGDGLGLGAMFFHELKDHLAPSTGPVDAAPPTPPSGKDKVVK